eukprot:EG_transcript_35282
MLLLLLFVMFLANALAMHLCNTPECKECLFQNIADPPSFSQVAVIVEARPEKSLVSVIKNFLTELPDWPVQVFHSADNHALICHHFASLIKSQRIVLSALDVNASATSVYWYDGLLFQRTFWQRCLAPRILIFQTDTAICSGRAHNVSYYSQYDYIGAPHHLRRWKKT